MTRLGLVVESDDTVGAGLDLADPNSRLAPFYLNAGQVAAVTVLAIVFVLLNSVRLWHTDVWGHMAFGEKLLRDWSAPSAAPLCAFADPSPPAVHYAWLSQTLFAAAYRVGAGCAGGDELSQLAGGADGVRVLHALLVTTRLGLLFVAFRRRSGSAVLAVTGLVFVIGAGPGNLAVARPQVVAEAVFAALLVPLSRPTWSRWAVWAVPLLMSLWANAHGSYPIGLMTIGALAAARFLEVFPGGAASAGRDPEFRRRVTVVLTSILAVAMLNPEGPGIFAATVAMASHPNVRAMDEWQPIWSATAGGARVAYAACVGIVIVALAAARGRFRTDQWLLLPLFAGPPLLHQRALVWFITAAPWIALSSFGLMLVACRPNWWAGVRSFRKTLLAALLAVVGILWSLPIQRFLDGKPGHPSTTLSEGTPWEVALAVESPASFGDSVVGREIRSRYPAGRFQGALFTSETLGDFFVWRYPPPAPVFIYSHVHLFSPEHWRLCTQVRSAALGWRGILDRARVNLVCVEAENNQLLCDQLRHDRAWMVCVDEADVAAKADRRCRLFVALRANPLPAAPRTAVQ